MSGGIQVVRLELRASLDAPLYDHVIGLTRPPSAYGVKGLPPEPEPPGEEVTSEVRDDYRTERQAWREARLKELHATGLIMDLGGVGLDAGRETIAAHRPAKGTPGRRAKPVLDVMIAGPHPRGDPRAMSPKRRRRWARESLRWLQKRVGPDMVLITATAHFDETAPHIQALFVPIQNGKLSWKGVRDAAAERIRAERGPQPGRKSRSFRESYRLLQDDYFEHVAEPHGLSRGEIGSEATHTSIDRAKAAERKRELAEEQAAAAERKRELAEEAAAAAERKRKMARATITECRAAWQAESAAARRELDAITGDCDELSIARGAALHERDTVAAEIDEVSFDLGTARQALKQADGEVLAAFRQGNAERAETKRAEDALAGVRADTVAEVRELDQVRADTAAAMRERDQVRVDTVAAVRERDQVRADTVVAVRERDAAQVASAAAVASRAVVERELVTARAEEAQAGAAVRTLYAYCRDELAPLVARGAATARAARRLWRARGVLNARRATLRHGEGALRTGWDALRTYTDDVSAKPLRRAGEQYAAVMALLFGDRGREPPEPLRQFGVALWRGEAADFDLLEKQLEKQLEKRRRVRGALVEKPAAGRLEDRGRV